MIYVINRQCELSSISINKKRPSFFSREKCYNNLLKTLESSSEDYELHIVFDGKQVPTYLNRYHKLIKIEAGTGSRSFKKAIQYALSLGNDQDIIYLLEDDYLHRPGWKTVLTEGIEMTSTVSQEGYISLYDHKDKYFLPEYNKLTSQLFITNSSHWRTTPSTTDTLAIKKITLDRYKEQFYLFSSDKLPMSEDHLRSIQLWKLGLPLFTPIPGWATHCEPDYMSPLVNWELI